MVVKQVVNICYHHLESWEVFGVASFVEGVNHTAFHAQFFGLDSPKIECALDSSSTFLHTSQCERFLCTQNREHLGQKRVIWNTHVCGGATVSCPRWRLSSYLLCNYKKMVWPSGVAVKRIINSNPTWTLCEKINKYETILHNWPVFYVLCIVVLLCPADEVMHVLTTMAVIHEYVCKTLCECYTEYPHRLLSQTSDDVFVTPTFLVYCNLNINVRTYKPGLDE